MRRDVKMKRVLAIRDVAHMHQCTKRVNSFTTSKGCHTRSSIYIARLSNKVAPITQSFSGRMCYLSVACWENRSNKAKWKLGNDSKTDRARKLLVIKQTTTFRSVKSILALSYGLIERPADAFMIISSAVKGRNSIGSFDFIARCRNY